MKKRTTIQSKDILVPIISAIVGGYISFMIIMYGKFQDIELTIAENHRTDYQKISDNIDTFTLQANELDLCLKEISLDLYTATTTDLISSCYKEHLIELLAVSSNLSYIYPADNNVRRLRCF